jgi:two-component system chemotaxis response regulator CheB
VIAIAASTGGPPALERVLARLPAAAPPVVIAQHLVPPFSDGFSDWLHQVTGRAAVRVEDREALAEGRLYVAGTQRHLRLRHGLVEAVAAHESELAPSADQLFFSAAASYGPAALGIVLTGMGRDGTRGLTALRQAGGWTIGQDSHTSVVYGMPRSAFEAGACCEVLPLDEVAERLAALPLDPSRRRSP